MEEENEAILFALIIGAIILGIGFAMFFIRPYTGFGAVVLAIGLMTLSLIITMRAEEIMRLKIYPTAVRSETMAEASVEPPSPKESAPQASAEKQSQEVLGSREPYEDQVEQVPEVLEVEEAQRSSQEAYQVQEVEETEQPYMSSMYESAAPQEEETATVQESYEEANSAEHEQEPEPSIEAASPDLDQSREERVD